ncbi:eukaryotic translation initiation factor 4E-2 [Nosema bombycis CQ1]|jgi:translation initiation factor 4E|uniref:Eukaryotic translation initiation factor 4E-2 n=1 Tax=Nosema bombycis (strain CQ1 / CVCC 102059) TaxID=578461 RepID=R0KSA2_NOSB1|nr:Eukaryotic translation initiation factor 4E-2 [Nosema bombycis CQ1]EOB14854.1 eukaryotic translation initiation factor 4E-2 [Nosema bombycis CQ1]|eukprot:EOB13097.1 Eukaryotic translation initiation factor 4E-2 [Nosema bombycis CQ1]
MDLTSNWIIWQNHNDESNIKSWGEDLVNVGIFHTVPEFLYLNDEINKVGLPSLESIRIFKEGIKPMWEDPLNMNGGRVILDIPIMNRIDVGDVWTKTMAFCVSNLVDGICGCVFMEKQNLYKLAIWIEEDDLNQEIMKKWKETLELPLDMFYYLTHKRSIDGVKHKKKWHKK